MHLLEKYATATGLKIDKPFIDLEFFPIPYEKYIVLQQSANNVNKIYDLWQEVVDFLSGHLKTLGIEIIQVGGQNDSLIHGCLDYRGRTSIRQLAYVVKNSLLTISGDCIVTHLASSFNIPSVSLFGISYPSSSGPYWGDRYSALTPDFSIKKPSFGINEVTKRINEIKPEAVISEICRILQIKLPYTKLETLFIGNLFFNNVLEVILDQPMADIKGGVVNLRLDRTKKENIQKYLVPAIIKTKVNILFKDYSDLPLLMLKRFKANIQSLSYNIDNGYNKNFILECTKLGIPLMIGTTKDDKLDEIRLDLFDYDVDFIKTLDKPNIQTSQYSKIKTNKLLFCGENRYASLVHYEKGLDFDTDHSIIDCNEFWQEQDYLMVYDYAKND